ncbi:MAG: hypothetical protein ACK4FS_00895 [Flavobacterium sp.]
MKNRILPVVLILLFHISSCTNADDKLEIYLTNGIIESFEGIPLKEAVGDSIKYKEIVDLYGEKLKYDTINQKILYYGRFTIEENDLKDKPFIIDSEILGVDFKKSEIIFTNSVSKKIYQELKNVDHSMVRGRQFVLMHNNNPVINGYLFSTYSSYWSNTYQIHFNHSEKIDQKEVRFSFTGSINFDEYHLIKNKKLVKAFEKRNERIIGM